MKSLPQQVAILLMLSLFAGTVDGAIRGFKMPPAATQNTLPTRMATAKQNPEDGSATPLEVEDDGLGMSVAELHEAWKSGEVVVIDARTREEYVESHIPDSFFVPFEAFMAGPPAVLEYLDPSMTIIVYCAGGDCHASRNVASMLIDFGYNEVIVFERGFETWVEAGYPTQSGEPMLP